MGYAVDYVPTRERRKIKKKYRRKHVTSKAVRARDMRNAVRWNLPTLEHDTTGTATVDRSIVINLLRLDRISPTADPSGDHVMQQLISDGILGKPERRGSVQVFDRAELLTSLKAWVGVL